MTRAPCGRCDSLDTDEGELLYLDRYYLQERTIREVLDARAGTRPTLDLDAAAAGLRATYSTGGVDLPAPDRQRVAAALAAAEYTSVIAGGPGTGKTHTVARVLALLFRLHGPGLRVGLTTPTGKAAARLQEEVREQAPELGLPPTLTAMTLHRLLGCAARQQQPAPAQPRQPPALQRHRRRRDLDGVADADVAAPRGAAQRVPAPCCSATRTNSRPSTPARCSPTWWHGPCRKLANPALATLVGADLESFDPDERDRLAAGVVRLTAGRRYGGDIAALAAAVRVGDADAALELLNRGSEQVWLRHAPDDLAALRADVLESARVTRAAALFAVGERRARRPRGAPPAVCAPGGPVRGALVGAAGGRLDRREPRGRRRGLVSRGSRYSSRPTTTRSGSTTAIPVVVAYIPTMLPTGRSPPRSPAGASRSSCTRATSPLCRPRTR